MGCNGNGERVGARRKISMFGFFSSFLSDIWKSSCGDFYFSSTNVMAVSFTFREYLFCACRLTVVLLARQLANLSRRWAEIEYLDCISCGSDGSSLVNLPYGSCDCVVVRVPLEAASGMC